MSALAALFLAALADGGAEVQEAPTPDPVQMPAPETETPKEPVPAKLEAPAPEMKTPSISFGGVTLTPAVTIETDARIYSDEGEGENGFALRRVRAGAHLQITPWAEAMARIEYLSDADDHVTVFDAFVEVAPFSDWRVSAGFRATPLFATARDEAIEALSLPELALPVRTFWPGRDLGAEVHRLATKRLPLEGWLRVGNGSGSPAGNDDNNLSFDARVDTAVGRALGNGEWFGFRAGVGGHYENIGEQRPAIAATNAGGFLFWRPPNVFGASEIGEAHVAAWVGPWTLRAEGAVSHQERSHGNGNPTAPRISDPAINSWGGYLEAAYTFFGTPRIPGTWPNAMPGWADWRSGGLELAARAEFVKLGEGATGATLTAAQRVVPGGAAGGELALRWWITRWLGWSLGGYALHYDRAPLEEPTQTISWLVMSRVTVAVQ